MRFYQQRHKFYCGIDLHAKKMYLCVLDEQGQVVLYRNMNAEPESLRRALQPFRDDRIIGVATNLRSVPDVLLVLARRLVP